MPRKVFSVEFKVKVALEALAGRKRSIRLRGRMRCIRIK